MKKVFFTVFYLFFLTVSVVAQNLSSDYKVISVNKKLANVAYNNPYQSPLENYVARIHIWLEGGNDTLYSETIKARINKLAEPQSQKEADSYLNSEITQVITYKDSVGFVLRKSNEEPDSYYVGLLLFENGKWKGLGEDYYFGNINKYVENKAFTLSGRLREYYRQQIVSTDTLAFVNYLKQHGENPQQYLLEKLNNYPLVIYGEIHRREKSWDLMRQLIKTPEFPNITGTVFMELSTGAQKYFDNFFSNKTKDENIILEVFRKEELTGWNDKGMFNFISELWSVNSQLPDNKKIKLIATDFQRPFYNEITTQQHYDSIYHNAVVDRNEIMAEVIANHINNSVDKRNNLFIVGFGHAYKSAARIKGALQIKGLSAAYILSEKFGKNNIFSIFTHSANMTNDGYILGEIRKGLFDYVFEKNGNQPVAFDLANSPFGKEPFDAPDMNYDIHTGNFADNYDGYIFLQPLQDEFYNAPLYELYTDEFFNEIKRRAKITGAEKEKWWGIELKDLNRIEFLENLKKENETKRFKSLNEDK